MLLAKKLVGVTTENTAACVSIRIGTHFIQVLI